MRFNNLYVNKKAVKISFLPAFFVIFRLKMIHIALSNLKASSSLLTAID